MSHVCEDNAAGCPGCAREYYEDHPSHTGFKPEEIFDFHPPFLSDAALKKLCKQDDLVAAIVKDRDPTTRLSADQLDQIRVGFEITQSHISDESLERIKTEFAKAIKESTNSWKVPIFLEDTQTLVHVSDFVEVVEKNGIPIAAYCTGDIQPFAAEEQINDHYGFRSNGEGEVLFGVWESVWYTDYEYMDLLLPNFAANDEQYWVSRCDGFREGPEE